MAADMEQELAEFNSPVDADKPSTPKPLNYPSTLHLEEATYPDSCLLSFFFLLFFYIFFCFVSSFQFLTIFSSRGYDRGFCIFSSWCRGGSLCERVKYPFSIGFNLYFVF